jgi:hypothetical protein
MAAEAKKEIELEIAHVLFIDIVGYSKLSINEQHAVVDELTYVVRASEQFQKAEASDRLIKIPTGRSEIIAGGYQGLRTVSRLESGAALMCAKF